MEGQIKNGKRKFVNLLNTEKETFRLPVWIDRSSLSALLEGITSDTESELENELVHVNAENDASEENA